MFTDGRTAASERRLRDARQSLDCPPNAYPRVLAATPRALARAALRAATPRNELAIDARPSDGRQRAIVGVRQERGKPLLASQDGVARGRHQAVRSRVLTPRQDVLAREDRGSAALLRASAPTATRADPMMRSCPPEPCAQVRILPRAPPILALTTEFAVTRSPFERVVSAARATTAGGARRRARRGLRRCRGGSRASPSRVRPLDAGGRSARAAPPAGCGSGAGSRG